MRTLIYIIGLLLLCSCAPQDGDPVSGGTTPNDAMDAAVDPPPAPKLDVLWVVDISPSTCQEQRALTDHVLRFIDALPPQAALDLRMAVTTQDVLKDQGVFYRHPATKYPNVCAEHRLLHCMEDADCTTELGGSWECLPPITNGGKIIEPNLNGSLNSVCVNTCASTEECCEVFCPEDTCAPCSHICVELSTMSGDVQRCVPQPLPCVDAVDGDWESWARCHFQIGASQSFTSKTDSPIKAAWLALDPAGPNAAQSVGFLRPDAHLLIVIVTDEDDCSIAEDFTSPSYTCEDDGDCPGPSTCLDGACAGVVKIDYYEICEFLGEYQGHEHHDCAYDLSCQDCVTDEDCPSGWECKSGKKCRPYIFEFNTVASFQQPAGTPLFALAPVGGYVDRYRTLKAAPWKVMVAVIAGDGLVGPDAAAAMISEGCIGHEKLTACPAFGALAQDSPCANDPQAEGCEAYRVAMLDCIRECFIASTGDVSNPYAKGSYICASDRGTAELGMRHLQLVDAFGDDGLFLNFCAPEGFGPLLEQLGEFVAGRIE